MPHLWPTGSSWGRPLDYGPVLLRKPFGPHLAMGALSSAVPSWRLQVHLGCVRLSPACPFRRLHTCHLRPARHYPRLWIRPPSPGGRRDFNPPDQCAAWRTLLPSLTSPCRASSGYGFLLSSATPPRQRDGMETSQVPVQCVRACLGSSTPRDSNSPCHSGESDATFGQNKSLGIPNFLPFRCSIAPPARAPVNA